MARIRIPAPIEELAKKFTPETWAPLLSKYGATSPDGEYLHWDKFKWKVEKGDNEEAAWLATKVARSTIAKQINLLCADKEQNKFIYCVPDSLFARLHHIDKITGGGHAISDATFATSKQKDKFLVQSLMMEEAITSSQLEGASTTRKVAKEMLQTARNPKDKSEQMIFNNFQLMKKVFEFKDQSLSIDLILELHQIATHNAIENNATPGEFRTDNDITISDMYNEIAHEPPCYQSLLDRMNALCEFANADNSESSTQFVHPVVKAIILHFMIGYIHPFGDGNGRTARALFYWFMLQSGYWLFEYVSISKLIQEKKSSYDKAFLYTESDQFDLTYFIYQQADIIQQAIGSLYSYIETKKSELYQFSEWLENSRISKQLKHGHKEVLKDAINQPGKTFTAKQVANELDVNENTARSYLNKLAEEELLIPTKIKKSRTITYIAPANLREKLEL
ncbi:Fic family protein [Pelagibaculum spongiae]|uniref:Cell filamentation protein Fic n=1 Tax=Pelagibaculum spongiae TaxID=2080658 RepID=A0A2V1GU82_9GAMM|nr:Fic family protein [Pelagibaculum spongiae]PVZ67600.1 cell filamentation protein Fic [Pelagibaculum spongiae]